MCRSVSPIDVPASLPGPSDVGRGDPELRQPLFRLQVQRQGQEVASSPDHLRSRAGEKSSISFEATDFSFAMAGEGYWVHLLLTEARSLKRRKSFQTRCFSEFYFGGISPFRKMERIALGRKVGISSSGGFLSGQNNCEQQS